MGAVRKRSMRCARREQIQRKLLAANPKLAGGFYRSGHDLQQFGPRACGKLATRTKRSTKFRAAIAIQEQLVAKSPDQRNRAPRPRGQLQQSGFAPRLVRRRRRRRESTTKAIAIQRQLVESHPINRLYQGDLARTYNNLGYVLAERSDWQNAELCYADAIKIQEHLVKASPLAASYRRDLAISYNNLGMVAKPRATAGESGSVVSPGARLQQLLLAAEPADAKTLSNLGGVYNNLGMLFDGSGDSPTRKTPTSRRFASRARRWTPRPTWACSATC